MIVGDGRPLRFLTMVVGGWIGVRFLLLWHTTGSLPEAVRQAIPLPSSAIVAAVAPPAAPQSFLAQPAIDQRATTAVAGRKPTPATPPPLVAVDPVRVQLALLAMTRFAETATYVDAPPAPALASIPRYQTVDPFLQPTSGTRRISVSAWMIARGGTGIGASTLSPQLGGTQGGVRIDYALSRRLAATARIAAPAAGAGRELSVGLAWRPAGAPVRLVAEQRFAIDGGRGGPAVGVSTGVSELRLPAGFRVDGYGQAGAIARSGVEAYVDASVRAARPVADLAGITLDAGGGTWGGAQRGVARLDIGPSIGARIPVTGRSLRIALDWRQRVAGNARPGSGPALTLGTDF